MISNQTKSTERIIKSSKRSSKNGQESLEELHLTLEQLRNFSGPTKTLKKSASSIEERLIRKHAESQAKIAQKRLAKHSKEREELKFIPTISAASISISMPRYKSEIKQMIENMKKNDNEDEAKIVRPQDIIPKPKFSTIKEIFESRHPTEPEVIEPNPFDMKLVDKSKYFLKKKETRIQEAEKLKMLEIEKNCTFKPDLNKSLPRTRKSQQSLAEIFNTEERYRLEDSIRHPAPNPKQSRFDNNPGALSNNYSELSPTKRIYSFKEGVDIQQLIMKSKPMVRYNVVTSQFTE
jgi:hypothetical protein